MMSKIPEFKNIEVEAEFWDTHDLTDFLDEFEEVEVSVKKPLDHVLSVRLDREELQILVGLAKTRGTLVTTLAETLEASPERRSMRPYDHREPPDPDGLAPSGRGPFRTGSLPSSETSLSPSSLRRSL